MSYTVTVTKELEKKKKEEEEKAKEEELKAIEEKAQSESQLLEVKERLGKLEEVVKEIAVESKKQSGGSVTKTQVQEDISETIKQKSLEPAPVPDSSQQDQKGKTQNEGTSPDGIFRKVQFKPVTKYESFTIDDLPGQQWIRLKRKFRENEEVKVEATMFDGAVPIPKSGVPGIKEDVLLHITLIVNISKGDGDVLEIVGSAWPDSIEITNLLARRSDNTSPKAYDGPEFKELDDEFQDTLYEFLEARGINEEMAAFLHEYMRNKATE
ncbi:unnamed protein product [Dovyalis caffra]|uniref:Uncharacterized protein n=1 Tax=Dovyalis caffra TaxID=77055 RepID=A0AAV1RHU3_9ROSI|nr:unnamed protein product [Dovyalis caffra]